MAKPLMGTSGRGAGEPSVDLMAERVFLHPIVLDARCANWVDVAMTFTPTLPGHGDRGRLCEGFSLDEAADEVAGWAHGPVDMVGALIGGSIALHFALNHPKKTRSLLVACTGARADREFMRARADRVVAEGVLMEETLARWFDPEDLVGSAGGAVAYARECFAAIHPSTLAGYWRALADHDVLERLAEINVPTTWVVGNRDIVHPPEEIAAIIHRLPKGRMVVIDAPHMAPLAAPEGFSMAVQEHFGWVSSMLDGMKVGSTHAKETEKE
jgi:3-oxoadipate enol-lactonase